MSGFNLKAVFRLTGLTPETLRAWERRYGAVKPSRSKNGRRVYTSADVQRLTLLSTLVRRGFRIGDIAGLSDLELTSKVEESREPTLIGRRPDASARGVSELIEALDRFDLVELKMRVARVRYRLSAREFALELVPMVMQKVGTLNEEKRISVAQEHALSQLIQSELRNIFNSLEALDGSLKPERKMLFSTREGDNHEIGVLVAAILCRSHGIRCEFLGANYPSDSLVKVAKSLKAHSIVLGLTEIPEDEERVNVRNYVQALDKGLPASVELWMGGSASSSVKRQTSRRSMWVFESLEALDSKLFTLLATA